LLPSDQMGWSGLKNIALLPRVGPAPLIVIECRARLREYRPIRG
jgi:hypothetical protein